MDYDAYKTKRRFVTVNLGIDRSHAVQAARHLTGLDSFKINLLFGIVMASVPAFIAISVLFRWWAGPVLIFVVTPMLYSWYRSLAVHLVLTRAEKDSEFFEMLSEAEALWFQDGQGNCYGPAYDRIVRIARRAA